MKVVYYHGAMVCERGAGKSWCPDCVETQDSVQSAATRYKVMLDCCDVGDRATWKDPECKYRKPPYNLTSIPTLIAYDEDGNERRRLACDEMKEESKVAAFFESVAAGLN